MNIYPIGFISLEKPDGNTQMHEVPRQEEESHCGRCSDSSGIWSRKEACHSYEEPCMLNSGIGILS